MSPGAVPRTCGIDGRPHRHVGLAQVVVGHAPPPTREHLRDALRDVVVALELDAHHLGDALARDVVVRRPEPAAHDHRVTAIEREAQHGDDARPVVTDLRLEVRVDARERELLADPRRVGVDDLTEQ